VNPQASIIDPIHRPLFLSLAELWTPPSRLPLSTWAEQNIILSSEYAKRAGRHLRLFGWQKEIFDAFTSPDVTDVTLMVGTQLCKTLFMQCAMAYVICEDPGPILLVEPTDTDAKDYSRERLAPMVRDCPCLHGRISTSSHDAKSGSNRLQAKDFPGGNLSLVGAGAPGNLARRTIRYLFCDEVDKYKADVKEEGDPINLAWERTATFQHLRRRIMCCSPTIEGRSRIGKAYKASDQRKPLAPCPKCGFPQLLHFFPDETGGGVRFDTSLPRDRQAASAYYECSNCHAQWDDRDRKRAANASVWKPFAPEVAHSRGYWISHLYSNWKDLREIVQTFLDSKDDRPSYKTFINTNLALEWKETGETPDAEKLYARREDYPFGSQAVIPLRGLFLTAAVDVQDDPPRLEVEVKAWGRGRESWSMDYRKIECFSESRQALPVTSRQLWDRLDAEVLQRSWPHASGHFLSIRAICIDTGSRPKPVYEFARRHAQFAYHPGTGLKLHALRTVIPVKGTPDQFRIISSVSKEDAARHRQGVRILGIGTHCAKQEIYDGLKHIRPSLDGSPVPGCTHFPLYDMPYFDGLCSEVRVVNEETGKVSYEQRAPRNEPLDLHVYNRGAAAAVGIDRFGEAQWRMLEAEVGIVSPVAPATVVTSEPSLSVPTEEGAMVPPTVTPSSSSPQPSVVPSAQISHAPAPPAPAPGPAPAVRPSRSIRGTFDL